MAARRGQHITAIRDHYTVIVGLLCFTEVVVMRWVAIFEDNPAADSVRKNHAQDHFDYLAGHCEKILIGGGLRHAPDQGYCGGLWILDVTNREEAVALCEQDPYFLRGLRAGYRLFTWGKAPLYGPVTL
jgi:uncharacterized protein